MADFLLTPEPVAAQQHCGIYCTTDENESANSSNIPVVRLETKTSTPVAQMPAITFDLTSPIEMKFDDISSPVTASSSPATSTPVSSTPSEASGDEDALSSAEKRQLEMDESERLAWQLMEEESMNAYQMQVDYMRANPDLFSEDDLAAVGAVLQEPQREGGREEHEDVERGGEEEEEEDVEEDNSREWTYEQLLELGSTIGDVKTERWKMRSRTIISSLPRMTFECLSASRPVEGPVGEVEAESCPVCMEEYDLQHEVLQLPCGHFFHSVCSESWLKENNSCPLCKKKITSSP